MKKVKSHYLPPPVMLAPKEKFLRSLAAVDERLNRLHRIDVLGDIDVDLMRHVNLFDSSDSPTIAALEILRQMKDLISDTTRFIGGFDRYFDDMLPKDAAVGTDRYRMMRLAYDVERMGIISIHGDNWDGSSETITGGDFINVPALIGTIRKAYAPIDALPLVDADEDESPALTKIMDARRKHKISELRKEQRERRWEEERKHEEELRNTILKESGLDKMLEDMKILEVKPKFEAPELPERAKNASPLDMTEQMINILKEHETVPVDNPDGTRGFKSEPIVEKRPDSEADAVAMHSLLRNNFSYTGSLPLTQDDNDRNAYEMRVIIASMRRKVRDILNKEHKDKAAKALGYAREQSRPR
jgi:hypothetical protein